MIALRETAVRLAAAGVGISFLLSLAAKTPGKEILRFAAACVTVILLAGALRGIRTENMPLTLREAALEQDLAQATDESLRLQTEEAERALADVFCENRDNKLIVKSVSLTVKNGDPDVLSPLIPTLAAELGIPESAVSVREELP